MSRCTGGTFQFCATYVRNDSNSSHLVKDLLILVSVREAGRVSACLCKSDSYVICLFDRLCLTCFRAFATRTKSRFYSVYRSVTNHCLQMEHKSGNFIKTLLLYRASDRVQKRFSSLHASMETRARKLTSLKIVHAILPLKAPYFKCVHLDTDHNNVIICLSF